MIRLWLRCAGVSGLVLFVPLLIILHAQPYRDPDLQAFLLTDDCTVPCFMGIQPGAMTTGEALALLNTHPWIETVDSHIVTLGESPPDSGGIIHWTWSGKQPAWIDPSEKGMVKIRHNQVESIQFQSTIPFGGIRLLLGKPGEQQVLVVQTPSGPYSVNYVAVYPDARLWVSMAETCPLSRPFEPFQKPVFVQWLAAAPGSDSRGAWSELYTGC